MQNTFMKYKWFLYVAIFSLLFCFSSCQTENANQFCDINLPVYPIYHSLKQGYDHKAKCKYATYTVKEPFPAKLIVEYLYNEFTRLGVVDYQGDGKGSRVWESFDSQKGEWVQTEIAPARYTSTWVDTKNTKLFLLQLYYKYNGMNQEWKNTLYVDCKVCKFYKFYQ